MVDEFDFEHFLKGRTVPVSRNGLEERIIASARGLPQHLDQMGARAGTWFAAFWDNILISRPAFALAAVLILCAGAFIGLESDILGSGLQWGEKADSFLTVADHGDVADLGTGEWL